MKVIREATTQDLKKHLYKNFDNNDFKLYDEVNSLDYIGIFQFTGQAAKGLVKYLQPENFQELNAINAFARPGTMDNAYLFKEGKEGVKSKYPEVVREVVENTNGVILYQEQAMKIFEVAGGFSLEEANEVRSLMKKLGKLEKDPEDLKKWEKTLNKFKKNAVKKGMTEQDVDKLGEDLIKFSFYSFNLSHSTSYTYLAAMTLYLSIYFRKYFYSSVLEYEIDRDKETLSVMNTIKRKGIDIHPPNVNHSSIRVSPGEGKEIYFGLSNIKHVSEKVAEGIVLNRPYESIIDFIIKTRKDKEYSRVINKRVIENLIKIGAFDELIGAERKKMLTVFTKFWEEKKSIKVEEKLIALWNKTVKSVEALGGFTTTNIDRINFEKELFGFNFFSSLFTNKSKQVIEKIYSKGLCEKGIFAVEDKSIKIPVVIDSMRIITDKNDNEMAFVEIEDMFNEKISVPIFASYWKNIKDIIENGQDKIFLMNLFRDDKGGILFGQKGFVKSEQVMRRMIKELPT